MANREKRIRRAIGEADPPVRAEVARRVCAALGWLDVLAAERDGTNLSDQRLNRRACRQVDELAEHFPDTRLT